MVEAPVEPAFQDPAIVSSASPPTASRGGSGAAKSRDTYAARATRPRAKPEWSTETTSEFDIQAANAEFDKAAAQAAQAAEAGEAATAPSYDADAGFFDSLSTNTNSSRGGGYGGSRSFGGPGRGAPHGGARQWHDGPRRNQGARRQQRAPAPAPAADK